jgi:hypothetical protein
MFLMYARGCPFGIDNQEPKEVSMSVEEVIHRMTEDTDFAHAMVEDPRTALEAFGLELPPEEILALKAAFHRSSVPSGATEDPTEWFSPQFNPAVADPTEWFEHQFQADIA